MTSLLPPSATAAERAIEAAGMRIGDVETPLRDLWNPQTCPAFLLPWLAWGLSIDLWDADWAEGEKRAAIASAIEMQRKKGTLASVRAVVDRFDPMIGIVEWFEQAASPPLDPYCFRLELPLAANSNVEYSPELVTALLRDIGAVKPVRAHMFAVHRLVLQTDAYLLAGAKVTGFDRLDMEADETSATEARWDIYLQTEQGEPILSEQTAFLEHD